MTRHISELDVPASHLRQQIRLLVARQRKQGTGLADRSAQRLQTVIAPNPTKPEEAP